MALWGTISPPTLLLPSLSSLFHAVVPSLLCVFYLNLSASSGSISTPFSFFSSFCSPHLCVSAAVWLSLSAHSVPLFPSRPSQLLLTAFLSLFFPIRLKHYCCTDCANVTTQSDITDNNKLFPKIPSDTSTFSNQFSYAWILCLQSLWFYLYVCVSVCVSVTQRQCLPLNKGSSQFTGQKKLPRCCLAITLPADMSVLWHLNISWEMYENIYTESSSSQDVEKNTDTKYTT